MQINLQFATFWQYNSTGVISWAILLFITGTAIIVLLYWLYRSNNWDTAEINLMRIRYKKAASFFKKFIVRPYVIFCLYIYIHDFIFYSPNAYPEISNPTTGQIIPYFSHGRILYRTPFEDFMTYYGWLLYFIPCITIYFLAKKLQEKIELKKYGDK